MLDWLSYKAENKNTQGSRLFYIFDLLKTHNSFQYNEIDPFSSLKRITFIL